MENKKIEGIEITVARIEEKVDGINRRLDASNGRLLKHDESLSVLDRRGRKNSTFINILWAITGAIGLAVLGIASAFVSKRF